MAFFSWLLWGCLSTDNFSPVYRYYGDSVVQQVKGKKLLIAMRGIGDSAKSFEEHGFIAAFQKTYPEFDVVAPNAHFGYYRNRSLLKRLSEDVIEPAKQSKYDEIWFAGVSLGGLGSLLYMECCGADITGALLIAPYTGDEYLHGAVEAYLNGSGAAPWEAEKPNVSIKSLAPLWQWIVESNDLFANGRVWMGYGDRDSLSGHDLLASMLPKNQVIKISGEHSVKDFMRIWHAMLERKPIAQ